MLNNNNNNYNNCHIYESHNRQKSISAEELTAEMANLEGLMKDLTAITQNDYHC